MAFAWMPACCEVFGNLRGIFFRFLNVDFRFLVHFSLFKCKIKSFRSVKGHQVSSKCAQRAHLFLFVSIPLVFYLCFDCVQPLHHFLQGSREVGGGGLGRGWCLTLQSSQGCSQWWTCQTSVQSTDRNESKCPLASSECVTRTHDQTHTQKHTETHKLV